MKYYFIQIYWKHLVDVAVDWTDFDWNQLAVVGHFEYRLMLCLLLRVLMPFGLEIKLNKEINGQFENVSWKLPGGGVGRWGPSARKPNIRNVKNIRNIL